MQNAHVDEIQFETKIGMLYQKEEGLLNANTNANVSLLQVSHAVALF